jgi:hypothetical protein
MYLTKEVLLPPPGEGGMNLLGRNGTSLLLQTRAASRSGDPSETTAGVRRPPQTPTHRSEDRWTGRHPGNPKA